MKVHFWVIGKTTDHYLIPGIEEYIKRLKRYCQFEYIELPAAKIGKNATEQDTKTKEAIVVLEKLQKSDFLAVMDEVGKEFTSRKFADFIANHQMRGTKRLIFLIGGAYGFSNKIYERADIKNCTISNDFYSSNGEVDFYRAIVSGFYYNERREVPPLIIERIYFASSKMNIV